MDQKTQEKSKFPKPVDSMSKLNLGGGSAASSPSNIPSSRAAKATVDGSLLRQLPSTGRATFSAMPQRPVVSRVFLPPDSQPQTRTDDSKPKTQKQPKRAPPAPSFLLHTLGVPFDSYPDEAFMSFSVTFSMHIKPKRSGVEARETAYEVLYFKELQRKRSAACCFPERSGVPEWEMLEDHTHWSYFAKKDGVSNDQGEDEFLFLSPTFIEWCDGRRSNWRQDILEYWKILQSECNIIRGQPDQHVTFYPNTHFSLDNLKRIAQALVHFNALLPHNCSMKPDSTQKADPDAPPPQLSWWKNIDSLKGQSRGQSIATIESQSSFSQLESLLTNNIDQRGAGPKDLRLEWMIDPQPMNQRPAPAGGYSMENYGDKPQSGLSFLNIPACTTGAQAIASLELPLAIVKAAYMCPSRAKLESYAPNAFGLREFLSDKRSPPELSMRKEVKKNDGPPVGGRGVAKAKVPGGPAQGLKKGSLSKKESEGPGRGLKKGFLL